MTPEMWARVRALVEAAMSLPPGERTAYLSAQAPVKEIRDEAEQLLGSSTRPARSSRQSRVSRT